MCQTLKMDTLKHNPMDISKFSKMYLFVSEENSQNSLISHTISLSLFIP